MTKGFTGLKHTAIPVRARLVIRMARVSALYLRFRALCWLWSGHVRVVQHGSQIYIAHNERNIKHIENRRRPAPDLMGQTARVDPSDFCPNCDGYLLWHKSRIRDRNITNIIRHRANAWRLPRFRGKPLWLSRFRGKAWRLSRFRAKHGRLLDLLDPFRTNKPTRARRRTGCRRHWCW